MALAALARKIFGSPSDRVVKRFHPRVKEINALEPELEQLSDEALRARTDQFRAQLAAGAKLDDLLVPAFATVREASKRVLGMRHFDVQLIGGMVLNDRSIAEMRTGEGKTLVATLPVYLNALTGEGVHVVTVNDYLARRDADWMGKIYSFLGMTTGIIVNGLDDTERKKAYDSDITYGTNNEFGFDYLRDNMKYARAQMAQRGHAYAIVDEVDSILIDEARTPLIISGPTEDRSELYTKIDAIIPIIGEGDFELDEKHRATTFTDEGIEKLEERLAAEGMLKSASLYDVENVALVHHLNSALRAHKLFQRDKDYIVRNGEVVIIDEFTGRMMPGRRYSEGLHQALEAKEKVRINPENQTLASITFQNYFRLYKKLAGMTGTAATEAEEFGNIYGLDVVTVPTNLPIQRRDDEDAIYRTAGEKFDAVIAEIESAHQRLQPVLVGTASIEKSEFFAEMLRKRGFTPIDFSDPAGLEALYAAARAGKPGRLFAVLNARHHEQEAHIVADAGLPGAITIATNMAGRGTDIQLGGNVEMRTARLPADLDPAERAARVGAIEEEVARFREVVLNSGEVADAEKGVTMPGGIFIIGTERHESRRIDNQLRGRSGRQGDPGRSKFFLSLQDDLMRIFPVESMDSMLGKLGLEEGEAITHPWVTKAIERAQAKVEARNFDIRKNILKYDDVMNDQRKVIFEQRLEFMDAEDVSQTIADMRHDVVETIVSKAIPPRAYPEQWDAERLAADAKAMLNLDLPIAEWFAEDDIDKDKVEARIREASDAYMAEKEARITSQIEAAGAGIPDVMRQLEKSVLLQAIDALWREHLVTLDHLSKVVGWRGIAQRDPLNEYKQEAYELFQILLANLREQVTTQLSLREFQFRAAPPPPPALDMSQLRETHLDPATGENEAAPASLAAPTLAAPLRGPGGAALAPIDPKLLVGVSRNAPCPCGSGKKFKHCHGAF